MNRLLITFYGDDFTGSTDALDQLSLAGLRAMLFIAPPTKAQLRRFPHLEALGVAGMTRSMTPKKMEIELRPALKKLKALGAPHVHYKICSTFDSSPNIGSIGRVIDVAADIFRAPFVPVLAAAPVLGRHCVFGSLFARMGAGTDGTIYRLDRHPSISKHPVTPMQESDLRLHLGKQTKKTIALFDILQVALPEKESRASLKKLLSQKPDVVLFDTLYANQMERIGSLIDDYASAKHPMFSVGSSGIEMALGAHWGKPPLAMSPAKAVKLLLVGSGSCSPVTQNQISWALKHDFTEVEVNAMALTSEKGRAVEITRAILAATNFLRSGKSVIVHTGRRGSDKRIAAKLGNRTARILGTALGEVLRGALAQTKISRVCIAGGDTSGFAARALGIEALEMISPLTPGAPLCRAFAARSPADGIQVVFKGGQVGAQDYFEVVKRGKL